MIDAGVIGANRLSVVGLQLKAAGAGGLRRELLAGIRTAAKPLVEDVRQAAREQLPKAGGLNERIATDPIAVRTRLTGPSVGVRIVTTTTDTRGADRGRLRHPVFGNRERWVNQAYPRGAGWFSKTLEREAPKVTGEVLAAMERVAVQVTRGV